MYTAAGVVRGHLKMAVNKEARAAHLRRQQAWVDYRKSHGMPDTKLVCLRLSLSSAVAHALTTASTIPRFMAPMICHRL